MALKKLLVQNLGRFQQLQSGDNVDTTGLFATGTTLAGLAATSATGLLTQTVAGTTVGRTLTGTAGNVSVTDGDGVAGNPTIDLVNAGTAVTDQFVRITTDAKGRVTATAAVSNANIVASLGYTPVNKAGDTGIGSLSLTANSNITVSGTGEVFVAAAPTSATSLVNKTYVDNMAAGLITNASCRYATTAALPSCTAAGVKVGKTLTATANGALSVDGTAVTAGDRIVVKNQASAIDNGIYVVTAAGSAGTPFVLTRATDFDGSPSNEVQGGDFTFVREGTLNANSGWVVLPASGANPNINLDVDNLNWTQFSGSGSVSLIFAASSGTPYTALTGSTITIAGTANRVTSSISGSTITLTGPQDIHTGASPTFVGATLSGRTANQVLYAGAGGAVTGSSAFTFNPTTGAFNFDPGAVSAPAAITIQAAGTATGSTNGASVTIQGGFSATSGNGGSAYINGGSGDTGGAVALSGGTGSASGGHVTLSGGAGDLSSGNATISGGTTSGVNGNGGNVQLAGGIGAGTGVNGYIHFDTSGVERLRILANGAWSVGSTGTNTGTAGYVLTTNGASSAPTWQSVSALISEPANQITYGTGSGIDSSSEFTFNPTNGSLSFAPTGITTPSQSIIRAASSATNNAAKIVISGGNATGVGAYSGGDAELIGGSGPDGGEVIVKGGIGTDSSYSGGSVLIAGGNGNGATPGGSVTVAGGTSTSGAYGVISFTTSVIERLRILADGSWSVGTGGTAVGTSGQALFSNGSGSAPTWQNVTLAGTTGTLPITRGGTGQTTQTAAFDALSPTTTLGDIIVQGATNDVRLPVGTNGQVLTADSTVSAFGVKWATPLVYLGDPTANGIVVRTALNTTTARSIAGTANTITVTNGDGVSANPTITIADNAVLPGTGSITLATGNNAQRSGSPTFGMIRANNDSANNQNVQYEVYMDATNTWKQLVWNGMATVENGFVNRAASNIAFVAGVGGATRQFTISAVSGTYEVWTGGKQFFKSSDTVTLADVSGQYYIYFDATGTLIATTTFTEAIITTYAFVAVVYWNTTTDEGIVFEERHGRTMDSGTHLYLHNTRHAVIDSATGLGIDPSSPVDSDGTANTHASIAVANGAIWDEDIKTVISDNSPQDLSLTAQIPILYLIGAAASPVWTQKTANDYPVIGGGAGGGVGGGTGRLNYNQNNANTWQLTECTDGYFVLVHYFATNNVANPIMGILGQTQHATITAARTAANTEIADIVKTAMPTLEWVAIGTVIFETKTAFTNTPKAVIRSTTTGGDYVDFRATQVTTLGGGGGGGGVWGTITGTLSNQADLQAALSGKQDLNANLTAISGISGTGIYVRTGVGTAAARTIQGTTDRITMTFGDGVSGDPTVNIAATYAGQSSITTLGTITTGTWNGTTIAIANGGTGATTAVTAFNALSPNTTKGDIIVHNGTNNVRQPVGTNGQVLMADSSYANGVIWATLDTAAVKSSMTNDEGSTITIGQAVYVSSAGNVSLADASGSGEEVVLGLVGVASIANAASGNIVSAGEITTSGLTAGAAYYLSETAGAITTTAPTATGSWVVPVGIALSTTRFLVRIGVAFQN